MDSWYSPHLYEDVAGHRMGSVPPFESGDLNSREYKKQATHALLHTNMFAFTRSLLLLLLTYQFVAQAADSPNKSPREEVPSNCVDGFSKRTLFNIIWGCVSTTIICAWAAIHPNMPPRESYLKGTLRRLELMFWAIVAPEILPAWALNQLLAAMAVRDVYNKEKGVMHNS